MPLRAKCTSLPVPSWGQQSDEPLFAHLRTWSELSVPGLPSSSLDLKDTWELVWVNQPPWKGQGEILADWEKKLWIRGFGSLLVSPGGLQPFGPSHAALDEVKTQSRRPQLRAGHAGWQ